MNISVVGTGYVGLVAGACFADGGNHVTCVDIDEKKIAALKGGAIPIYEPGLKEIVDRNAAAGRLDFTTNLSNAVAGSRVIFLAVGTPSDTDGSADLSAVLGVAESIAKAMDGHRILVMKSTVPVGTHKKVAATLKQHTSHPFDYVSNPEFMKEGAAIDDFVKPDRVVIGTESESAREVMRELYAPFMRRDERIYMMDAASAEMTKYAANAMLATRISFMNEVACLCEAVGADVEAVRRGIGSDARIGSAFLYPGVGYGGSCFPKDVRALISTGREHDEVMSIAEAVDAVNVRQRQRFAARVLKHFEDAANGKNVAVWGLAFKAKTDDIREAPAIDGIELFAGKGLSVKAFDPEAMSISKGVLGEKAVMCKDQYEALEGADALVIFTDWPNFKTPDFERMASLMNRRVVFDGRNLWSGSAVAKHGFEYHCIGRPTSKPT